MKTNIKACRFFAILVNLILFFNLFVLNVFNKNKTLFALFLIIYWLTCRLFVKPKESKEFCKKYVIIYFIIFAALFLIILYIIGIIHPQRISEGLFINPIKYISNNFIRNIFPHFILIIYGELMRSLFIVQNDKKSTIWITIALILTDIIININIYHYSSLEGIFELVGCLVLSSIAFNLLFNFIAIRYGSLPNILFKIITVIIYGYICPVLPDIYPVFESLIKVVYPFIIYLIIDYLFANQKSHNLS